jgi:hypothetical protein
VNEWVRWSEEEVGDRLSVTGTAGAAVLAAAVTLTVGTRLSRLASTT